MPINPINLPSGRPPRFLVLADTPALGMKMMTTQVMRGLSRRFPEGNIGVVTSEGGANFYKNCPYPIHLQTIPDNPLYCDSGFHHISSSIRAGGYDVLIALPFQEHAYAELILREKLTFPVRIGSNNILGGYFNKYAHEIPEDERFTHDIQAPDDIVAPQEYMGQAMLRYLEPLGINGEDLRPEAWSSAADKAVVDAKFKDPEILPGDFLLVLNMSANQGHHQWRMDTLAETAKRLSDHWDERMSERYGRLVFLANYYQQGYRSYFEQFQDALKKLSPMSAPVIGMSNNGPGELAQIISRSSYVITTETGTAHVAQALDIPATVVYQSNYIKRGWMLPGARVMPVVSRGSTIYEVSPEEVFFGSILPMLEWCKRL